MSGKLYIQVECEYDFSGGFGGNNNQEIFQVDSKLDIAEVDNLVENMLLDATGLSEEDLDGEYHWEYYGIEELK